MHDDRDEFYVGYLPTPPMHLRVVRLVVLFLSIWILGMAAVIVVNMRDPGQATWAIEEQTWWGRLVMEPYPMLFPVDASDPFLIVEMGKHGAHQRLAEYDAQGIKIRGFLLERDGRRIIELSPEPDAIRSAGIPDHVTYTLDAPPEERRWNGLSGDIMKGLVAASLESTNRVQLNGEIVDGKCYLGAMKPGDGLTHKACATLCIRGGLPPMFVTQTPDGPEFRLLIVDGMAALDAELLALVAEPVRIEGDLVDLVGMPAIRASAGDISLAP